MTGNAKIPTRKTQSKPEFYSNPNAKRFAWANNTHQTWLSLEHYYRWSDYGGTKIIISNPKDKMNCNIEHITLFSKQFGCLLGLDTGQKLLLGLYLSPDQKNAVEIRWYQGDPEQKWQIVRKYQSKIF